MYEINNDFYCLVTAHLFYYLTCICLKCTWCLFSIMMTFTLGFFLFLIGLAYISQCLRIFFQQRKSCQKYCSLDWIIKNNHQIILHKIGGGRAGNFEAHIKPLKVQRGQKNKAQHPNSSHRNYFCCLEELFVRFVILQCNIHFAKFNDPLKVTRGQILLGQLASQLKMSFMA